MKFRLKQVLEKKKKNESESDLKPKKEIRLTVEWRKSDRGTK